VNDKDVIIAKLEFELDRLPEEIARYRCENEA